ncbi:hypothetical protein EDB92DRAFT_1951079 [Lactarius akahatsu]|uniref:DUF6534 domain-containing protein n=1 Tax=Lactarius akahatsu TaxID=416441 RepID=A0AAD4LAJ0_9AGAM|nr:hypothetical protein EDB92DRAFT_1951079 [Lactarius akahatsu]
MAEYSEARIVSTDVVRVKVAAPLLFGPLFNWALYGVLCVQIYVYSYNFPDDRRSVKFLAYFVFVLETVQTALTGADIYYWFVDGFGNVERLARSHFSSIDSPVMRAVISLIVQGYFCYRIWVLNKRSSWICWVIAASAVTQAVAGMWLGIESHMVGGYAVSKTAVYLWSIPSALADILIAVAMTLLLRSASSKLSSFVLIRVVRLTIETNTLTAGLAITTLVLYAAFPDKLYYMTKIIGKVYSNTLLVSLNNRIYFREHKPPGHGDSACLTVSDRVRATALSSGSLRFASLPESQSRTPTGDNSPLCTISAQTVELGEGKGDDTSIRWSPSHPRKCHLPPDDPEYVINTLHPSHRQ